MNQTTTWANLEVILSWGVQTNHIGTAYIAVLYKDTSHYSYQVLYISTHTPLCLQLSAISSHSDIKHLALFVGHTGQTWPPNWPPPTQPWSDVNVSGLHGTLNTESLISPAPSRRPPSVLGMELRSFSIGQMGSFIGSRPNASKKEIYRREGTMNWGNRFYNYVRKPMWWL